MRFRRSVGSGQDPQQRRGGQAFFSQAAKPYRREMLLGPLFKFLEAVFELLMPLMMLRLIQRGQEGASSGQLLLYTGGLLLLIVLAMASSFTCQYMAAKASQGIGTQLRDHFFQHLQRISQEARLRLGIDHAMTCLFSDINKIQVVIAFTIRLLVRAPFLGIGAVVLSFTVHRTLAWILFLILPCFGCVLGVLAKRSVPLYQAMQTHLARVTGQLSNVLEGMRVVRSFRGEAREKAVFQQAHLGQINQAYRLDLVSATLSVWVVIFLQVSQLALLYWGGRAIQLGTLMKPEWIALMTYVSQIVTALLVIANLATVFPQGYEALNRLKALDEEPVWSDAQAEAHLLEQLAVRRPELVAKDLSYTYPGAQAPAIQGVSFSLSPGQSLGIIGGTGSGKTTLVEGLMGLMIPDSGTLTLADIPLDRSNQRGWMKAFAYASQKPVILEETLETHLQGEGQTQRDKAWPDYPGLNPEEALAAAQVDFYHWPTDRLKTLHRGGKDLSGGQRQRLALARALSVAAPFWVLDDPASALDFLTARRLREALKRCQADHAVILTSQRIEMVAACDEILVLDQGRLVGQGTHQALLAHCPAYQALYQLQFGELAETLVGENTCRSDK